MRPVIEHRSAVLDLVTPVPTESRHVLEALGDVLAVDVVATCTLPRWDNSAMDGYAVHHADTAAAGPGTPVTLPVVADIAAGTSHDTPVAPGTAVRIMTGAPVPAGVDSVVPVEHTDGGTEHVTITTAPVLGAHIRRAGEDVNPGDVVLTAGTFLGPAEMAAAVSVGQSVLTVHRRPRAVVISTGTELVPVGAEPAHGQIPDSNSVLLAAAAHRAGCTVVRVGAVPDDPAVLAAVLEAHDGDADLILTSGGVSVGAYDVVKQALADSPGVEFVRVAMQPGKPQGLGRLAGGTPVLCLPGNPVSAHVTFEVFVRPAIMRLRGARDLDRPQVTAVAAEHWRTPAGRTQLMPVTLVQTGTRLEAHRAVAGGSGSHLVAGLARAEGLAVVPATTEQVLPGDRLTVMRTTS
ncbi:molybdopterin molybdotransferase MoeA [Cellulomonas bogoriensis]|uniref:Molybdopterin molybdenumtransferase n=1 Tax=Cellulomonas bogoriensis 69B4 = DSM 16987 TaxID=1386082 RepID=A0A0A0C3U9_9CELL|nr:gephyrin-like molybdotransferase Glp [Cellulomonas bogoriensis]KGM14059.1 molybdopterin molybdenumtransferase [Cellulomonas bogoriensis 69B4 = DSM 16987]